MNKTFVTILVIAIVVVGGYFLLKGPEATAPTTETEETSLPEESTNVPEESTPEEGAPATQGMPVPGSEGVEEMVVAYLVTYTNAGFSPSSLTIKAGETVTFQNNSTENMWTTSGIHPTHTLYSGTSFPAHCPDTANVAFDACQATPPGESWSFTFTKVGTWPYHNHLQPTLFGKIIVE